MDDAGAAAELVEPLEHGYAVAAGAHANRCGKATETAADDDNAHGTNC